MKTIPAIFIVLFLIGMTTLQPANAASSGTYTLPGGSATTISGAWRAAGEVYKIAYDLSGGGTITIYGIDLSQTVADGNPWPAKQSFYVQFGVQEAARFWGMNPRYAVFITLTIQGVSGVDRGYPWWYIPPATGPEYMRSYLVQTWYTQKLPWNRNDEGEPVAFVMGNGHGFNDDYSSGSNTLGIPNAPGKTAVYDTFDLKLVFTPNPDGSMRVDAYSRVYASGQAGWRAVPPAWAGVWPANPAFNVPAGVIDWSGAKVFTLIANSGLSSCVSQTYTWNHIEVIVP